MAKYQLEDVDYRGCDPIIQSAVDRGKAIKCYVSDEIKTPNEMICEKVWIIGYAKGSSYPYVTDSRSGWEYATPMPAKQKYVKDSVSIMKLLIEAGYNVDSDGYWAKSCEQGFANKMWQFCGKEPSEDFMWGPEWLESK